MHKKKLVTAAITAAMVMGTIAPATIYAQNNPTVEKAVQENETEYVEEEPAEDAVNAAANAEEEETPIEEADVVTTYEALRAAIGNVEAGGTITLGDNITGSISIEETKTFTLDLGGKTLTGQVKVIDSGAEITVKNGTITYDGVDANSATVAVGLGQVFLEDGLTVISTGNGRNSMAIAAQDRVDAHGVTVRGNVYGIGVLESCQVTLTDMDVSAKSNPISTGAALSTEDMNVTIEGGTYTCEALNDSWEYAGIYWASHGTLTINKGTKAPVIKTTASTSTPLFVKNGTIVINDGKFKEARDGIKISSEEANAKKINVTINGGEFQGSRTALYIKSLANGAAKDNYKVTVTGGTFEGGDYGFYTNIVPALIPEVSLEGGYFNNGKKGFETPLLTEYIKGGTYEFNPEDYVAQGYGIRRNPNGTWTVK